MDSVRKELARRMANRLDAMRNDCLGLSATPTQPPNGPNMDELMEIFKDAPPAPPKIQFAPDYMFPQEHYADEVVFIRHHPAHQFFARIFRPDAESATVMRGATRMRADAAAYRIGSTFFVPESLRPQVTHEPRGRKGRQP